MHYLFPKHRVLSPLEAEKDTRAAFFEHGGAAAVDLQRRCFGVP